MNALAMGSKQRLRNCGRGLLGNPTRLSHVTLTPTARILILTIELNLHHHQLRLQRYCAAIVTQSFHSTSMAVLFLNGHRLWLLVLLSVAALKK
jgi:hypothetical protein